MGITTFPQEVALVINLGLIPIPLKSHSKKPLVRWRNGWSPTPADLNSGAAKNSLNWGVRCDENFAVIDCDPEQAFHVVTATGLLPPGCPVVKTGCGYHIWVKPKRPIRSQEVNGIEIKSIGSYVVAPPSIHPNGVRRQQKWDTLKT